jgi:hypothetical protein
MAGKVTVVPTFRKTRKTLFCLQEDLRDLLPVGPTGKTVRPGTGAVYDLGVRAELW